MKRHFHPKLRQIGGALLLLVFCFTSLFVFAPKAEAAVLGPHSSWAEDELYRAYDENLIPDRLYNVNLTRPITRAEMASVLVKTYEAATGYPVQSDGIVPFVDTRDPEVIKAFGLGLIKGVGNNRFAPNDPLTREQAATMIDRTYKSIENIKKIRFKRQITFNDDYMISNWAHGSVYFFAQSGIIAGMGNNFFAPQAQTSREQALLLALRLYDNYPYIASQDFVTYIEFR